MHENFTSFYYKFFEKQNTVDYLGQALKKVYKFVREELSVLLYRGLVKYPVRGNKGKMISGREKKTIGTWVGIIYKSLKGGKLGEVVIEALVKRLDVSEKPN
jgi:phenylalanine ammonia-lyase